MPTSSNLRSRLYAFSVVGVLVLAGCTTTTIKPQVMQKPAGPYDAVVVGNLKIEGELWQHLLPHFRHAMVQKLRESKAFGKVLVAKKTPAVAAQKSSSVVSGRITEIDKGSAAARILIGFGAGRAKARGEFAIRDPAGNTLAQFGAVESYSGGAGIGGWTMIQMEELLQRLGASTAETVVRWSKGEDLKPASVDDKPGP